VDVKNYRGRAGGTRGRGLEAPDVGARPTGPKKKYTPRKGEKGNKKRPPMGWNAVGGERGGRAAGNIQVRTQPEGDCRPALLRSWEENTRDK